MNILIIAQFTGNLDRTFNSRFTYLCDMMSNNKNIHIEFLTSDFSHDKKTLKNSKTELYDYPIVQIHESGYPTNVCIKRFVSHHEFGKNVRRYLNGKHDKPDVVYCAVPSLSCANAAADYCRRNNIRFILDVQDLWPEAFKMVFPVPVISDLIFAPLTISANRAYSAADSVVAVSQTYCDRVMSVNKKCKAPLVVYLGTDMKEFDSYADLDVLPYVSDKDTFVIAYAGTLGRSYNISSVIEAVAMVKKEKNINARLLVMGNGPLKDEFEKKAKEAQIDCLFTGYLPYPEMAANLMACDIAVNPITKGSAGSIINKVGDYAMAGLPVINTQESSEYRKLLEKYNAGINCGCDNTKEIADAICTLYSDDNMRKEMGRNSRKMGEQLFDRAEAYRKIVDLITSDQ